MKAPNKFIKYIEEQKNIEEIMEWILKVSNEPMDINEIYIIDKPIGEYQDDDEYCYQTECSNESGTYGFEGTYYHKFEDSDLWLGYEYYMDV